MYKEEDNIKNLIPLKVANKELGISYKTLYKWIKEGKITYTKIGSRFYLTQAQIDACVLICPKNEVATNE